ncbi:DUF1553 domain-containing protein [Portibacter marinus]|uniref:DUF1553 domain-containing protein n=1 Tax=Portibacter marinus TaxID=2898660 RepID=UPI001F184C30|nr:DUF1553 domain-containing protein [Portibacter marinus]
MKPKDIIWCIALGAIVLLTGNCSLFTEPVDYNTDVKPILNRKCISCHGGVKQSAGFSLLSRDLALSETESEKPAIIPGSASESEFIRRLTLKDPEERMPLGGEPLTQEEINILTKWVDQGAQWGLHWAYKPLTKEPEVLQMGSQNEKSFIDIAIDQKLSELDLKQNASAEKSDLLRRVSFDLIGMPAPADVQQAFLEDELSYEDLIDRLLSMPSFGEKWASMWLDVARYADSKGFEKDRSRDIWRYRDYLIRSFNQDKPYDDFIIEQLAGDMLENPSQDQLIATGFHRNTPTNDEGGTDNEEYRVKAVMDRVNTTWEGILGTTMACVQCHGHPYDPFPHEDYYESYAFFNNTRDADTEKDYPLLNFLDSLDEQQLQKLTNWIETVDEEEKAAELKDFVYVSQPIIYSIETDELVNAALYDTKYLGFRQNGTARIPDVNLSGKEVMWINLYSHVHNGRLSIFKDSLDGELLAEQKFNRKSQGYELVEIDLPETEGYHDIYFKYSSNQLSPDMDRGLSVNWFYFGEAFPGNPSQERTAMWKQFESLVNGNHESTLIMTENPEDRQRKTFVFDRGNWQIHAAKVEPGTPGVLPPMEEGARKDRLGYARWIASPANPLTSRTYVNRVWEQIFGMGIVRTVEDLGSQGDKPTHPDLLDQLAYKFANDYEWSTKRLLKSIMASSAYRQSSMASEEKIDKDPYNQFLSRGPRNRLTAEQIRDQALFVSDLLVPKMYGPPVKPYQPDGIWNTPYNNEKWVMSEGEDRYRRAIYTMIKRTSIYPAMETFDMASRQLCTSRRIDSNTPLQALVTLNDPAFVEISEAIGLQILNAKSVEEGIDKVYFSAMNKKIHPKKLAILHQLYEETKADSNRENAEEIAALTVANAIINLDDFLNK